MKTHISICVFFTLYHVSTVSARFHENKRRRGNRNGGGTCSLEVKCDAIDDTSEATSSMPVSLPIMGPPGPGGPPGLKGDKGQPGFPGVPGLPGKSAQEPFKVAFFVGLQKNFEAPGKDSDVVFDNIITNVGGAYQEKTGRFRAPVRGSYKFNIVISAQGRLKAAVNLMKNGSMVLTVWTESIPFWASASNTAILELEENDEVWLVVLDRAPYLHGYMYTTFSGHILFET